MKLYAGSPVVKIVYASNKGYCSGCFAVPVVTC